MAWNVKSWWTIFRFRHILLEMAIAFSLAFLVWLHFHSRSQQTVDHQPIAVQVQLNPSQREQFMLETTNTQRVTVSFTAHAARLKELRKKLLRNQIQAVLVYTVPEDRANEATYCDTLQLDAAHVQVPPGVIAELADLNVNIPVTVHRLVDRTLPIRLEFTGDVRVSQIKLEPATVLVRGPKVVLDRAEQIATVPYAFPEMAEEPTDPVFKDQATLATEFEGRPLQVAPKQVTFRCNVSPKRKVYTITELPVRFMCPELCPWRARFADEKAGKINLKVIGPAGEGPPPVVAFVDLTSASLGRGRNLQPVRLQLPKDFQLLESTPPLVPFLLEERVEAAVEANQ